ncbi:MAG: DNA polymerase/3'-5' exonuclease PolX [Candidatus Omnitrophica bacterium]|nr:DNA polymerase/3'-5' exonuclease PolX [Candidatus Omnitrophota bacterium]
MKNQELTKIFDYIADILEIKGDNLFRIRAYRRAARNIENLGEEIEKIIKDGAVDDIPGIGEDLAEKIKEYVSTGKMWFYEKLKKSIPKLALDLMAVPGVGPKTAKILCDRLKAKSIKELEKYLSQGRLKNIPGLREKKIANILKGIKFIRKSEHKIPLGEAFRISEEIISRLKKLGEIEKITAAGSLRRMKETIRDIDILIASLKPQKVIENFTALPEIKQVASRGKTKSTVITKDDVQIDMRVVRPQSFGSALCYFTGSKNHNIRLRKMAVAKGLKMNEYGIFEIRTNKKIAGKNEESVYSALGLAYIPPEMREDKGEIELARGHNIPRLLELEDIKGDLHVHSDSSDGMLKFEDIALICREIGYEYVVITDHSKSLRIAGGLSEKELFTNIKKVRKINKKTGIRLLIGSEVDILDNGRLDYGNNVLKELDFAIAAIHSGFRESKDKLTYRFLKAIESKFVNMIAHPTGRLMGVRDAYEIDLDKILKTARDANVAVEINAFPARLDLDDNASHRAKELGVTIGISTDTHTRKNFGNMFFGVGVARRAWLEKKDVLNTLSLADFLKKIRK